MVVGNQHKEGNERVQDGHKANHVLEVGEPLVDVDMFHSVLILTAIVIASLSVLGSLQKSIDNLLMTKKKMIMTNYHKMCLKLQRYLGRVDYCLRGIRHSIGDTFSHVGQFFRSLFDSRFAVA